MTARTTCDAALELARACLGDREGRPIASIANDLARWVEHALDHPADVGIWADGGLIKVSHGVLGGTASIDAAGARALAAALLRAADEAEAER